MFSKNQHDTLPPTPQVPRAAVHLRMWKVLIIPQIPRPSDHNWEEKDGRLVATMTDQLPALEYSIEMSSRTCQKTHFVKGKFLCSVNGLTCTYLSHNL